MSHRRLGPIALALSSLLLACGGSGSNTPDPEYQKLSQANVEEPATAFERELLARLAELEPGVRVEVAGGAAIAERAYASASGRTCRRVSIEPPEAAPGSRLACLVDGAWSFVPQVLAPDSLPVEPGEPRSQGPGEAAP
jgi:hypothetical protein